MAFLLSCQFWLAVEMNYYPEQNQLVTFDHTENAEVVFFGDFESAECEQFFINNGVQNVGVEFLCDTYNATKTWVEEGCKHSFALEPIDDEVTTSITENNASKYETKQPHKDDSGVTEIGNCSQNDTVNNHLQASVADLKIEETAFVAEKHPKPSSWASLFKGSDTSGRNQTGKGNESCVIISEQMDARRSKATIMTPTLHNDLSLIAMENDERAHRLAGLIKTLSLNYNRHHLQLRGLINRSNWCYINTTLQALLGIAPISHFYKSLKQFLNKKAKCTSTPLTDSMIAFFNEFEPINPKISLKKQTDDLRAGAAFEPTCVYDVLPVMKTSLSEKGRQQDAEEFLSFLLNGMHDELIALHKITHPNDGVLVNGDSSLADHVEDKEDDESWEHVGPKNKSSTMRKAVIEESLIKHMFGGVIRSSVHQTGMKESATLQPFFTLQLDIQSEQIWTLVDAIQCYFTKENLQGFNCSKTNTEVEASRRSSLEELPLIMIFHLKYFVYDLKGGCQKIYKALDIPVDLEIPKEVLSPSQKSKLGAGMRNYKLYAVIYHHGKYAAGGHYTAAVHHGNPFGWVHFDDNLLKTTSVNQVLKHQQGSVPYLLFYERVQAR